MSHCHNLPDGPQLVMIVEPETKYRFRYESEGGSHGGLTGREKKKGKKTYPTVKLVNYNGPNHDIFIRVSLYTENKTEHVLEFKKKKSLEHQNYIDEELKDDHTAMFKNLTILSKKKEEIYQALMDRKVRSLGRSLSKSARERYERENSEDIKKEAREILNSVILRFDAFEQGRPDVQISPPLYSDPICNQKASSKGDLKIHRMSKVAGSWLGGEEIILLCDKVQKDNIKILFYDNDVSEGRWEAYATFSPADVHYQVAIPFKTPKYKENTEKRVAVCLERQGEFSEPRYFTYIPEDCPSKKRKKCVPENLMSPMIISSPDCSTSAVSDDSLQETVFFLNGNSMENICKSQENGNNLDSFDIQALENPSSVLDPSLLNGMELSDILNNLDTDFTLNVHQYDTLKNDNENITQMLNEGYCDELLLYVTNGTEMDIGKIGTQITEMKIEDPKSDLDISRQICQEKSRSAKESSKNQKEKLEKYLHYISERDDCGNTLLHLAVLHNKNIGIVMYINKMTDSSIINIQNSNKQTALHIAVEKNNDVVKSLLMNGGNPNIKDADGNNCYHIASRNNCDKCMSDLFMYSRFSHELNDFNYEGLTPLHVAIMENSTSCFDIMRRNHMANVKVLEQKCGRSLLHYAAEFQPSLIVPILAEVEIDVNIQDFMGNTPLHIACATANYESVKQLLLANANPLVRNFKPDKNSEEENSDDGSVGIYGSVGETPADVTKDQNIKILELLKQASEKCRVNLDDSTNNSRSMGTSDALVENLCNLLDPGMRWKDIATYVLDEIYLNTLKCSPSPTKTLIGYMKKTWQERYIEHFKAILEMVGGCNDVIQIITESNEPLIVL